MSTYVSDDVSRSPSQGRLGTIPGRDLVWPAMLLFLLCTLYFGVFVKLVHDWYMLPDFSHGFVIPVVVAYLVWHRWDAVMAAERAPSWKGLYLLAPGLLLLLLGVLGAELFLARVSFPLVLGGAVWLLVGMPVLRLLRFPLWLMLLGIPLPQVLFNEITLPLQLLASTLAAEVLPLLHVPVLREGNVMQLPSMRLEVAEACSGIRSLMSLFTLAVLYVSFMERSMARRVSLVAASLPIAVLANAFRIVGTGVLVQFWSPERALGFFHEFSGLIIFVVSLAMIVGLQVLLHVRDGALIEAGA